MTADREVTLKKGATGAAVSALQSKLNQLGYALNVDGAFGDDTERAVEHLQKSFGYDVDGIVGSGTHFLVDQQLGLGWKSPVGAAKLREWSVVMKKGSQGEAVRGLQSKLVTLGYSIAVDGDFGVGTERAVKHLQQSFGYDVDGVVGEGTHFLVDQQLGLGWKGGT